ncbi:uncharacterized protein LOC124644583 isoform X1 [Helicoverpa zea]|uniref:uncharacterized protein LOC124644583 isoform X1 n=2 Tax=Helicoverpa zea TaxID=7113 RepID=UPI001F581670|nr:uncharacterized protein LOC124644583 isoform X1 [Helicoverpa zea]
MVMTAGIKPVPIKLRQCLISPLTLYELSAAVVDSLDYPDAFKWTETDVAKWMVNVVGLPQYRRCIFANKINGKRLLRMELPSSLPDINIHDYAHIAKITAEVRKLYVTDFIRFSRSIGLPFRKPLTHCTWFKARTGMQWGIRQNWTRSDILRWMQILNPKPLYLDHWDLVWYQKADFPKTMFARIPRAPPREVLPHYEPPEEFCNEYLTPRRFRLQANIPEDAQLIWMEHRPGSPNRKEPLTKEEKKALKKQQSIKPKDSRLIPKRPCLTGLSGKDLILARRKMPKPKFLSGFK